MKINNPLGNPLQITIFSPFSSTVLEYSTIKASASNNRLTHWSQGNTGVLFPSTIVHFRTSLVQLDNITCDNFSDLALVGGAV